MMNFPSVSPKTIARIARGAVYLEQRYSYNCHGWSNHYCIIATYPDGYGASITVESEDGGNIWEVALLKNGELLVEDDGYDYVWSDLTEEDAIRLCDNIYFK